MNERQKRTNTCNHDLTMLSFFFFALFLHIKLCPTAIFDIFILLLLVVVIIAVQNNYGIMNQQ